ncbi:MAG TPA: LysR family transcriptional regulator [Stellaceae bacterium]
MANRKPSQSWDNLRYFLAVARTGTLSAAAEQFGTEHTTVARHIHALEDELNSRLFHRCNSGYGLTEVRERLLAGAEAIEPATLAPGTTAVGASRPLWRTPAIVSFRNP